MTVRSMLTGPRRGLQRTGVAVGAAVLLLGLFSLPAQAHRNGCHRWHSCPSDTGSYVCGDLGYYTYCGGDSGSGQSGTTDPLDITAPQRPKVTTPHVGPGGKVGLTIRAEQGSRIEVQEIRDDGGDPQTVAHATATGAAQTITFTAPSGRHTYTVTATDASGNTSDASDEITLDVDAKAPDVTGFSVTEADPRTAMVGVTFASSEAGGSYRLTVDGRKERFSGPVTAAHQDIDLQLTLPNGDYTARLTVTDKAGNTTHATRAFPVALSRLAPGLRVDAAPGSHLMRFTVTAPPRSRGSLTVGASVRKTFTADADGTAVISTSLPDGAYSPPVADVTDVYGRTGVTTGQPLVIDTVAPTLKVAADTGRARYGKLALAVTTEPGAKVTVAYGSGAGHAFPAFTAASRAATTVTRAMAPATYTVTVTARDAHGNTTTRRLSVIVDDQLTTGQRLALLVTLLLLATLVVVIAAVRRRTRPAREARRAAEVYRAATEQYDRAVDAWERRRRQLVHTAEFAAQLAEGETDSWEWSESWGRRKRGEAVYWVVEGDMVEPGRDGSSVDARDAGTLVITGQRVLFVGRSKREWRFDKLRRVEHPGLDVTWMQVSNRTKLSGVRYGRRTDETRVAIELAVADAQPGLAPQLGTGSDTVLARLRQAIAAHDRERPQPPSAPAHLQPADAGSPVHLPGPRDRG